MSGLFSPMRLTVIGIGYLGLTHAVCLADLGHEVVGLDTDPAKVAHAASGEIPFFEPGLESLLRKNLDSGRLRFTTSYAEAAEFGDIHFVCVGTPQSADGSADMRHVHAAADALAPYLSRPCLVVGKSTVPVGSARRLAARIRSHAPARDAVEVAWNPEFLREGFAIEDSLSPDRLVFGVTSERSAGLLRQVYASPLASGTPGLFMDLETAELVKVSANAFLATKISFINAMAEVCEQVGADVVQLAGALAHDERIGKRFLAPGLGFGGGCLPKDIRAFRAAASELGVVSVANLLAEVDSINLNRRSRVVDLAREAAGGVLAGRRITVLGLAFKPGSDDVRDSPSLHVCGLLMREGAVVTAHDPVATENAARVRPDLCYAGSVSEASVDADVVLHLTEWADYRAIDPAWLAGVVASPNMIDARYALDERLWRSAGWSFRVLGRP
jgi:UDPglucose 6-dehydrogenase